MVVNFKACRISRGAHKLARKTTLNYIKKKHSQRIIEMYNHSSMDEEQKNITPPYDTDR